MIPKLIIPIIATQGTSAELNTAQIELGASTNNIKLLAASTPLSPNIT